MRNIDIVESRLLDRVLYNGFDREWVQKLGSDEATACFGSEKYTEPDDPTSQGERAPCPRTGTPNSPYILGAFLLSLGLLPSFLFSRFR